MPCPHRFCLIRCWWLNQCGKPHLELLSPPPATPWGSPALRGFCKVPRTASVRGSREHPQSWGKTHPPCRALQGFPLPGCSLPPSSAVSPPGMGTGVALLLAGGRCTSVGCPMGTHCMLMGCSVLHGGVWGARTHPALNDGHPWDPSAGHKPSWAVLGTLAHPVRCTAPGIQLLSGEHPSVRPSSMCSLHGRNPAHHTQDRGRAAPRKPRCPGVNSLGELGRAASPPCAGCFRAAPAMPGSACPGGFAAQFPAVSQFGCLGLIVLQLLTPRCVSPGAAFSGWQPLLHHHRTLPQAQHDPRARPGMSLAA